MPWNVGFASVLVVVGHDSEYADLSNPRGEIIRERFYALAEDPAGHRKTWGALHESPESAEAAYVLAAPPVELWDDIRPAYGSDAYAANWQQYEAEEIDRERKLEETESL